MSSVSSSSKKNVSPNTKSKEKVIIPLKGITPLSPLPWTAKVVVLEKCAVRESVMSPTKSKYKRFIIGDSEGTRVQMTLFNKEIGLFAERLQINKEYYISNATLRPVIPKYQVTDHPFQWVLNPACLLEEVPEKEKMQTKPAYNFVGLDAMCNYKDGSALIDALVIVIKFIWTKERYTSANGLVKFQEFIVIDQMMKPVVLTIWEKFLKQEGAEILSIIDTKPILACMRVSVNRYIGLSLTSKSKSTFLINPVISDATNLRSWLFDNMATVETLLGRADLVHAARSFGKDVAVELSSIMTVIQKTDLKVFFVDATVQIIDYDQKFTYRCCKICNKRTSAELEEEFFCNHCAVMVKSELRLCVEVLLTDSTGTLEVKLFGVDAEKVLGCSAEKIEENRLLGVDSQTTESLFTFDNSLNMVLELKEHYVEYNGGRTRKFAAMWPDKPPEIEIKENPVSYLENGSAGEGVIAGKLLEGTKVLTNDEDDFLMNGPKGYAALKQKMINPLTDEEEFNNLMKGPTNDKLISSNDDSKTNKTKRKLIMVERDEDDSLLSEKEDNNVAINEEPNFENDAVMVKKSKRLSDKLKQ